MFLKLKNGYQFDVTPISHVYHDLFNRHSIVVVLIISLKNDTNDIDNIKLF